MIAWLPPLLLAAAALLALWRLGRLPRGSVQLAGAALFFGIAGYAWQGSPGLPGRPTPARASPRMEDDLLTTTRGTITEKMGGDAQVLDTAAAFHRQGLDAYSVGILKGAISRRPRSAELWLGLGNALIHHAGGMLSPAAAFALDRARALDPKHPGPDFLSGFALIAGGQVEEGAALWRALIARAPEGARWRNEVAGRLAMLESIAPQARPIERQATDAAAGSPEVTGMDPLRPPADRR
ncbi:tetratricopeptide repeat protein [Sphingomonas jatrophae]|uniref:Cytochrome c-type biogenesis protein CcmH n=1 Tax=Sphingomonas jatrophae TaxID=1166337 RepID=A0A1I6JCG9_9SPHN|nr:cytochrome C biogenesis protein [Sphingomonas jatrophae]SFR76602.1 hypothetical protein SAMN05192580_0097 [Sphingomonas jatrophae]